MELPCENCICLPTCLISLSYVYMMSSFGKLLDKCSLLTECLEVSEDNWLIIYRDILNLRNLFKDENSM